MLRWGLVPSLRRAIQAFVLSALLLAACGDEGRDPAGDTIVRFVAPIQFTDCELEFTVCCIDCPAGDFARIPECISDPPLERGEEYLAFMDLPPAECTVNVLIQVGDTTCEGSKTFQVENGKQTMVDMTVDCPP